MWYNTCHLALMLNSRLVANWHERAGYHVVSLEQHALRRISRFLSPGVALLRCLTVMIAAVMTSYGIWLGIILRKLASLIGTRAENTIDQEMFVVKKFSSIPRAMKIKRGKKFSTTKVNCQNSTLPRVTRDGSRKVHEAHTPKRTSGGPGGSHETSEARTWNSAPLSIARLRSTLINTVQPQQHGIFRGSSGNMWARALWSLYKEGV